ncbi:MAG: selenide, water dikinase SelD, partial [Syntrophales bacterium]|nr:selenide, water dikinase SelD [Syntrophales bacterium]
PLMSHPDLIVGMEQSEDAGVYKLRDDLAIIQTLDFFTPVVDDPYLFGQIAVVNALSDVYAMGGRPVTAMNIVCFPIQKMDISILRDILHGGLHKMREAEVLLVGGHSVEDDEPKYGLSVTGVVHPDKVLLNHGAKSGDKLILTKSLGTGIVSTAVKAGIAPDALAEASVKSMTTLNKKAAELMVKTPGVHACTDVTGFGLLGHDCEMLEGEEVGMVIDASSVPYFPGIRDLVEDGILPSGLHRNRDYRSSQIRVDPGCPEWLTDIFFDPQTAGGLLIAVEASQASGLLKEMHREGLTDAAIIGEVTMNPKGKILIK